MKAILKNFAGLVVVYLFTGFSSPAQNCNWASQAGGTGDEGAYRMAMDRQGNTYIFGGTSSDSCCFLTDTIRAGNNNVLFIAKYNTMGTEQWVKEISGGNIYPGTSISMGGMKYDTVSDCLLVSGTFYYRVFFGDTLLTGEELTVFILKMSTDGEILWVRTAGGIGADHAYDLAVDELGNVYISGFNQHSATFGNITIPPGGFLAKYDASGNLVWAENKFGFHPITYCEAPPVNLSYYNQTLFVNGNAYNDTILIDTIIAINHFSSQSSYLSSFNSQGGIQWFRLVGESTGGCGTQFAIDVSGNIILAGVFHQIGIFENDTLRNNNAFYDCFLAKYTNNGSLIWVKQLASTDNSWGRGLALDDGGNPYLSGDFSGSATFGNTTLVSGSTSDFFVTRFSLDGNCQGVRQYNQGVLPALLLDQAGNLSMAGSFENTLVIGSNTFNSRGGSDIFIANCSPITGLEEPQKNEQNTLLIYANPNTGKCNITIPDEFKKEKNLRLQIYDNKGRLIQQTAVEIAEDKIKLNIEAQAKGMYTAILSNGTKSYSGKIVFE